jgi:ribosomal protein L6P/L9E
MAKITGVVEKNEWSIRKMTVDILYDQVKVSGKCGILSASLLNSEYYYNRRDLQTNIVFSRKGERKISKLWLIQFCRELQGGYAREMELIGMGYSFEVKNRILTILMAFGHDVKVGAPEGILMRAHKKELIIFGISLSEVKETVRRILRFNEKYKYKLKGMRDRSMPLKIRTKKEKVR